MKSLTLLIFSSALCVSSVGAKPGASGEQGTAQTEDLHSFEIWKAFPEGIAITETGKGMTFECVQATRTKLSAETQSGTYDFTFPANGKRIAFHVTAGANPGSVTFTVGDDPTVLNAQFYFTDYETCAVQRIHYEGDECVLWVRKDLIDSIPQTCIDHYQETCGVTISSDPKC